MLQSCAFSTCQARAWPRFASTRTFHSEGMGGDCMYPTDILKVPIISVPGNGGPGCSVQRPAPGGSRGPAPSETVKGFEQYRAEFTVRMQGSCRSWHIYELSPQSPGSSPGGSLEHSVTFLPATSPPWRPSLNKVTRQLPFAFCLICFGQED